jgi:hypothetical protein
LESAHSSQNAAVGRTIDSRFQIPGLVGSVFNYYIGLVILELAQREQYDVALVNPDLMLPPS